MLSVCMRALWAFVVVCLMAVHGVPPARAQGGAPVERVLRAEHPALPVITTARSGPLLVRAHAESAGPTWAIAAAPPVLPRFSRMRLLEAPGRAAPAHVV